jgi:hypothetical protein
MYDFSRFPGRGQQARFRRPRRQHLHYGCISREEQDLVLADQAAQNEAQLVRMMRLVTLLVRRRKN